MKPNRLFLVMLPILAAVTLTASKCGNENAPNHSNDVIATINAVNATIVEECSEYEIRDNFSILLDEYPTGVICVYSAIPIPDSLRTNGLRVVVSGNILEYRTGNECLASPEVKLAACHKFEITNLKKLN